MYKYLAQNHQIKSSMQYFVFTLVAYFCLELNVTAIRIIYNPTFGMPYIQGCPQDVKSQDRDETYRDPDV